MKDYFENNCDVVRDLLPLYADGECSEKTGRLIKEHLETCRECGDYLRQIKKPLRNVFEGEIPYSDPDYSGVISKLRRRKIIKHSIVISAVIVGLAANTVMLLTRRV